MRVAIDRDCHISELGEPPSLECGMQLFTSSLQTEIIAQVCPLEMAPPSRTAPDSRTKRMRTTSGPSAADLAAKHKLMEAGMEEHTSGAHGMVGPEESAWAQLLRQQYGKGEKELGLTDSVKTIEVSSQSPARRAWRGWWFTLVPRRINGCYCQNIYGQRVLCKFMYSKLLLQDTHVLLSVQQATSGQFQLLCRHGHESNHGGQ